MGRIPWRKLWADALRSSPKWAELTTTQKGFWLECFLVAKNDGRLELRPGEPLTSRSLALSLKTKPATIQGWQEALVRSGLADVHDGYFRLLKMEEMQKKPGRNPEGLRKDSGRTPENGPRELLPDNGLQRNFRIEEKRREERGTAGPASSRAVPDGSDPWGAGAHTPEVLATNEENEEGAKAVLGALKGGGHER